MASGGCWRHPVARSGFPESLHKIFIVFFGTFVFFSSFLLFSLLFFLFFLFFHPLPNSFTVCMEIIPVGGGRGVRFFIHPNFLYICSFTSVYLFDLREADVEDMVVVIGRLHCSPDKFETKDFALYRADEHHHLY